MRIDGAKMLVFGGVCGNAQALRAVFRAAERAGIAPANRICTGDLAAYCADGDAVCSEVRKKMADGVVVRGNCERAIAGDDDECGCGFAEGGVCDSLSASWFAHAKQTISAQNKEWFKTLPEKALVEFGGRALAVTHAAAESDNEFIFASTSEQRKAQEIDKLGADGVIAGHCGIPFTQIINNKLWHNSGALGMPANDGTPRAWFSVLHRVTDGINIEHHPLHYAYNGARHAMQKAKMQPHYQQTLRNGIWPANDILPPREKSQQGVKLQPPSVLWRD